MRGEFDPPAYAENTERASGLLLDSLTQFPATYEFQLVVKPQQAQQQGPPGTAAEAAGAAVRAADGSSSGAGNGSQLAAAEASDAAVLERYRQLIADTTAADIPPATCTIKRRLGGKYLSLTIPARVQAAHVVDLVWEALGGDPAVVMKY